MTFSQIKKSFSQDHNFNTYSFPKLEIIKKSQIYYTFLTPRHHASPYPIQKDSEFHLNPGDKLELLGYNRDQIIVQILHSATTNQHPVFTIHKNRIKKFIKVL